MNGKNDVALVLRAPTAIEKAGPGAKRILAVMVADVLALAPIEGPEAWFRKGLAYFFGDGVPQDSAEAAKWYRAAAEEGHVCGQLFLGVMYRNGIGVPQDRAEEVRWRRKAGEPACGGNQGVERRDG